MKSIEIFNETNSNLNKAVNMAFELEKNGYMVEISDHCRNYITIYWRQ